MQAFLNKTAKYIVENYDKNHLDQICIVLPNRRAGLYLQKYLAQHIGATSWAPSVFSIEDLIEQLSGLRKLDPVYLLFELYEVHREVEKTNAVEFVEFLNWGQVLLGDFNEIDQYLIDPKQLFSYLSDSKAISLWNPAETSLTDFELKYLRFYRSLKQYYDLLTKRLLNKKKAYQGLIYRFLANNIDEKITGLEWQKLLFVGFNAFSKAEEKIIDALLKANIADVLWDADAYYMEDDVQEAGRFLRKRMKMDSPENFKWVEDNFHDEQKIIKITGVPKNIGQVKYTGQILNEISPDLIENTAVVLNDESLVNPVLNSIPLHIKDINLTMGLPLKETPLYDLIRAIYSLHENSLKFNKQIEGHIAYYYKDVFKILENQFFYEALPGQDERVQITKAINESRQSNKVFYNAAEILALFQNGSKFINTLLQSIYEPCNDDPNKLLVQLDNLLILLKKALQDNKIAENSDQLLEIEYIYQFSKVFRILKNIMSEVDFLNSVKTFVAIFEQIGSSIRIPFSGEPLKGLQIMGMLETRTLDFENVIMLSVNEDMIPAGKSANSFIPFEIKKEFNLPTYRDKDAIFAYHFYRILQRAKNIYLIYNTEAGDMGGGDRSRFINQMIEELPDYNDKIKISQEVLNVKLKKYKPLDEIRIDKTDAIINKLKEKAKSGFSPTNLNIYRKCSLRYYFQQVAGIEEMEDVQETIEASTLGTVIHEVLKHLYLPYVDKNITSQDIKLMFAEVEKLTRKYFKSFYAHGDIDYGKNLLIVKVAVLFIENFLKTEMSFLSSLQKDND